jgi:pantoate--beta-alanine ligase
MMQVWHTAADWLQRRDFIEGRSIGFVPTMGALHAGHASLVERCRRENDVVVVSIFVNPSQFNDPRDLERYPRTLETDLKLLRELGADEVIVPGVQEMYPQGHLFRIERTGDSELMEAGHRPGFLQGVLTVVMKLLNLVRADRAYFGEKDYQQLRAVSEMVADFFIPTEIVACPTVREASGLAMSSRNVLLSAAARNDAADLFRVLSSTRCPEETREVLEARGFAVDYVEEHWGRRLAAVVFDGVRLIDNVPIPEKQVL